MIRLFFIAYYHMVRLTFGFLMQFQWFQTYLSWCGRVIGFLFKLWLLWVALILIAWLFWDLLPYVALCLMAWHVYNWRRREVW